LALAMADKDPTMALQLEKNALETLDSACKNLELLEKKSFPLISMTSYKANIIKKLDSEYGGIKAKIDRQTDSLSGKDYALYKIVQPKNPEDAIFDIRFVNAIFPDSNVDSVFKVWHADKKIIDTIKNHDELTEVVFPTESNEAMALYKDQNAHYWGTKRYYKELIKGKNDRITSIAAIRYAVIGYKMLSALNNKRIVEWNLNGTIRNSNNRPVVYTKDVQFDDSVVSIAISPNRAKIFTASDKGMGNIWPADTSNVLLHPAAKRAFNLFQDTIICSAFSNDGSLIVTGSKDNTVKIWTADSGNLVKVLNGHKGPVTAVAFSVNNNFVFTASIDGTFRKWQLPEADHLSKINSIQWNKTKSFDSLFILKIIESNTPLK
jgi:WD40 repeat protein